MQRILLPTATDSNAIERRQLLDSFMELVEIYKPAAKRWRFHRDQAKESVDLQRASFDDDIKGFREGMLNIRAALGEVGKAADSEPDSAACVKVQDELRKVCSAVGQVEQALDAARTRASELSQQRKTQVQDSSMAEIKDLRRHREGLAALVDAGKIAFTWETSRGM